MYYWALNIPFILPKKTGKSCILAFFLNLCKPLRLTEENQWAFQPANLLQSDFNIDARWQVKAHQRINGFVSWVNNVHQALMCTNLKLVA